MNGIFDTTSNRTYNNAKPNYDPEDGIDVVECHCECSFKDIDKDACLFETCVLNQFPLSIPFHSHMTRKCQICDSKFTVTFKEYQHPFVNMSVICEQCKNKLKSLLQLERVDGDNE